MPQAPSLVGEVLDGRYKIVRKLGEGGMGEVFAAEHVHIEKRFAVKLLRPEIVSNVEAVQRFRQEARSASSIGHRNIIAIEDFGALPDGRIYMCMELLNGAALNDLIAQPQPVDRLLNILIQTGHGLAAAHVKGIIHRDMKPENIFVTVGPNGEDIPKLLDFGIAKVAGNDGQNNLTRTGTIFGTPFYMAPEQALGNPVDARTDVYAMGVIMYEVFAGSLPFQGESFMGILTQHITTEPEPVAVRAQKAGRQLPPGLPELITRCLQKNPAQRHSSMDELVNALVQIYRSVSGPGMSTYMEAFPVPPTAAHQIATPPRTGAVAVPPSGAHAATVMPGAQTGPSGPGGGMPYQGPGTGPVQHPPHLQHPTPPHHLQHPPTGPYPGQHPPHGPYSASGSTPAYDSSLVQPKKSNLGLIIAIISVLAVGGAIAAFLLLDDGGGGGGGGGDTHAAIAKLGEFRDEMCECRDKACTDKVTESMAKWSKEQKGTTSDKDISEADRKLMTSISEQMSKCITRALLVSGDTGSNGSNGSNSGDGSNGSNGSNVEPLPSVTKELEQLADRACTCKDKACTRQAFEDLGTLAQAHKDLSDPRALNAIERASNCLLKAGVSREEIAAINRPRNGSGSDTPQINGTTEQPKQVLVMIRTKSTASFEIWEDGKKLMDGPDNLPVTVGQPRRIEIRANRFKKKELVIDGKKTPFEFRLERERGNPPLGNGSNTTTTTTNGSGEIKTPPPPPRLDCTKTLVNGNDEACRKQYCALHKDDDRCDLE